jgi:hypothetical protein
LVPPGLRGVLRGCGSEYGVFDEAVEGAGDRGTKPPARSDMIAFGSSGSTRSSIIESKVRA